MFDGTVETFERLRRPNTANIIALVGDRVLVQTQRQPDSVEDFTSLPGGRVDAGEHELEAAKRELLEETGYTSDDWQLWHQVSPIGKIEWTIYTYIARNCRFAQPPQLDKGEEITSRLLDFEEFLMLSEDKSFYEEELVRQMIKCRFDPQKKEELKLTLWPSQKVAK